MFELVKNAYDADASTVTVVIAHLDGPDPRITVADNGCGMTLDTIRDVWLVPADDHRMRERADNVRSPKYNRLPLGEKGVGHFAVHKLGDRIEMVTRASAHKECVVSIDWRDLMRTRFLDEAPVTVREREPVAFTGSRTGTIITVSNLRETDWSRRDIRELWRQLTSITSPFHKRKDRFEVSLRVPDRSDWLRDLPDVADLLRRAPWKFTFQFYGHRLAFSYSFDGVPGIRVLPRTVERSEPLQIYREIEPDDLGLTDGPRRRKFEQVVADATQIRGIGPVSGEFYVFDRDRAILSKYTESRLIERFLDINGGIRVYRDSMRVYKLRRSRG